MIADARVIGRDDDFDPVHYLRRLPRDVDDAFEQGAAGDRYQRLSGQTLRSVARGDDDEVPQRSVYTTVAKLSAEIVRSR